MQLCHPEIKKLQIVVDPKNAIVDEELDTAAVKTLTKVNETAKGRLLKSLHRWMSASSLNSSLETECIGACQACRVAKA
ncbi:MAG: hypothetical protein R3D66_02830 [Alphaproteobacteria bacterium]